MKYHVYILKSCIDGTYYVGMTGNLIERIKKYSCNYQGYTAKKRLYFLVYSEEFDDKGVALTREKQVKSYKGGEEFKKLIRRVGRVVNCP